MEVQAAGLLWYVTTCLPDYMMPSQKTITLTEVLLLPSCCECKESCVCVCGIVVKRMLRVKSPEVALEEYCHDLFHVVLSCHATSLVPNLGTRQVCLAECSAFTFKKCLVWVSARTLSILTEILPWFSLIPQVYARIVLKLGHFLPYPFHFICHPSIWCCIVSDNNSIIK